MIVVLPLSIERGDYFWYDYDMELCVILHNIRSVYNVGSIFRTSDAVGVSKIYLTGITPTPVDRLGKQRKDFIKVSLGAEKAVAWEYARSVAALIKKLKKRGFFVVALEQARGSISLFKFKPKFPLVLVVGNEVRGIPPRVLKLCDKIVEIPMRGKKESLNVSVAFGIAVFSLKN